MSTTEWPSRVVPAQLSFLAIYNPALGPTDETFEDQLVFYYSRVANEARSGAKKNARNEADGAAAQRREENAKLRQIGLAQGMVDFAKTFSQGEPVDSIETEKSRIVLRELERGWWILASIDLTQLPAIPPSESSKTTSNKPKLKPTIEYSSREVSPPALLIEQILQAHSTFGLHHGPSLDDLFVRLSRENFCSALDRFWSRFCRGWDVLLHGSPAVDIFTGIKLAGGGELGYGVGEEDWGSGEREVLEDLIRRTEGLQDVLVSRFGDPTVPGQDTQTSDGEALPWMGSGTHPGASDGLIFSGMGALERHSIRDVSGWMRQIYSYGEFAYGVRDNPLRDRRKRRRRNPAYDRPSNGSTAEAESKSPDRDRADSQQGAKDDADSDQDDVVEVPTGIVLPKDKRPEIHPAVASHDHTTTPEGTPTPPVDGKPNIPPPIVIAAERALKSATRDVDKSTAEKVEASEAVDDNGTTLGIPDQYMKYLTFGLSTLSKSNASRPSASRQSSASIAPNALPSQTPKEKPKSSRAADADEEAVMASLEPMPDGETLRSKMATQIRQENKGHFLIGLRGDLDAPTEEDDLDLTDGSLRNEPIGSRIVLRTIQVELTQQQNDERHEERRPMIADPDISNPNFMKYQRLRVLVYIHRPFIYCFLFQNRTSSLQYVEFYRSLHQILSPIRTALLSSTDVTKVARRIENSNATASLVSDAEKARDASKNTKGASTAPIYDLIYDPRLLTVHTSIPNIPVPGTPAAEGIFTALSGGSRMLESPSWTRLEALNVHSQVLNTLQSAKTRQTEVERTSKTSRGWWVVWMKVPPSAPSIVSDDDNDEAETPGAIDPSAAPLSSRDHPPPQPDMHRIAFLARRASDAVAAAKPAAATSRAVSSLFGNMSLTGWRSEDPTGGASAGWGPGALAGGIGVDARRYVEGLLSLNR